MLFEVPVDHFPVQRAAPERPQRPFLLRIPQISLIQRQEVSAAVEPLSPSVRRSQFMFPKAPVASSSSEESSRTVVADIPVERKASRRSPAVQPQQLRQNSRTFQTPQLMKFPFRLLSAAILQPHFS
ncbi:hypothetical protein Y032_0049g1876 [Ancylostoma ceylanicum]|uniref:Uncharacterized protein n=1 Tax=Ancylostoma ceylanicum TaxID=53326 RepID=A0A016U9H0_9BILA|nr:hypothetical protein Y032_0049g1876 [Ancylostoma ceylanicum]